MNLKNFIFPTIPQNEEKSCETIPILFEEADRRLFYHRFANYDIFKPQATEAAKWYRYAAQLVFNNRETKLKIKEQNNRWTISALYYIKAYKNSQVANHREKIAIIAMILSEIAFLPENLQ